MSHQAPVAQEEVFFIVGGINDAPGFKIVGDGHGGFKIVPVPGWDPLLARELGAALKVAANAGAIKNAEASKTILNAAAKLAHAEINKLVGGQKGGQTTVVVVS